jgi:hypothetical protein
VVFRHAWIAIIRIMLIYTIFRGLLEPGSDPVTRKLELSHVNGGGRTLGTTCGSDAAASDISFLHPIEVQSDLWAPQIISNGSRPVTTLEPHSVFTFENFYLAKPDCQLMVGVHTTKC